DIAESARRFEPGTKEKVRDIGKPNVRSFLTRADELEEDMLWAQRGYPTKALALEIWALLRQALQISGSDLSDLTAVANQALRMSLSLPAQDTRSERRTLA